MIYGLWAWHPTGSSLLRLCSCLGNRVSPSGSAKSFGAALGLVFPLCCVASKVSPRAGEGSNPYSLIPGGFWSFPRLRLPVLVSFPGAGLPLQREKHRLADLEGLFQPKWFGDRRPGEEPEPASLPRNGLKRTGSGGVCGAGEGFAASEPSSAKR